MRDVDRSYMPRRALLLLIATAGCPGDPPAPAEMQSVSASLFDRHGETTVLSYVQLGWVGDFETAWGLEAECRPDAAVPAGILAPVGDGRWRSTALGDTRVPCGARDGVAVHVRAVEELRISLPDTVRVGDTFSAYVTVHDRTGQQLHRNADVATWSFADGLGKGSRDSCMDIRSNDGDSVLVHATELGEARIRVALGGTEATVDVTVQPSTDAG